MIENRPRISDLKDKNIEMTQSDKNEKNKIYIKYVMPLHDQIFIFYIFLRGAEKEKGSEETTMKN